MTALRLEHRIYAQPSPGMHIFTVPIKIVRYRCHQLQAISPPLSFMEDALHNIPGAAYVKLEVTGFYHCDDENGVVVAGEATLASWWRKSAPPIHQRREYGGPGGWPTPEEHARTRRYWLGFPPPAFR